MMASSLSSGLDVRPATARDVAGLAALWHARATVAAQFDARLPLLPDAPARWAQAANAWLDDPRAAVMLAERDGVTLGFVHVVLAAPPVGYGPGLLADVLDMVVDQHQGHGGVGSALWQAACTWMRARGVVAVRAHVPRRAAVEQAFWRAKGGTLLTDVLWLRL